MQTTRTIQNVRVLLVPILVIMRSYFVFVRQEQRGYQITAKGKEGTQRERQKMREGEGGKKREVSSPKDAITRIHVFPPHSAINK
jgi:hypothetical protein